MRYTDERREYGAVRFLALLLTVLASTVMAETADSAGSRAVDVALKENGKDDTEDNSVAEQVRQGQYDVKAEGLTFCGFVFGVTGSTTNTIEELSRPYRRFNVAYVERSLVEGKIFKVSLWDVLSCSEKRKKTRISYDNIPDGNGGTFSYVDTVMLGEKHGEFDSSSERDAFLDRERVDIVRQLERRYGVNFKYKEPRWFRSGNLNAVVGRYRFEMESPSFLGKLIASEPVSEIENAVKRASGRSGGWDGSVDFVLSVTDVELEREHNAVIRQREEAERRHRKEERLRQEEERACQREEKRRLENEQRKRSQASGYDAL